MFAALFIGLQRILPARLFGRLIYMLTRSRNAILKNLLINGFTRIYPVDTSEAGAAVPAGYESFNAFFTRSLKPGARPIDPDAAVLVSPADGTIQQIGTVQSGQILQVKGMYYSVSQLFGGDADAAAHYCNGSFVTIYLAPWNYHRVHMPAAGRVSRMRHVAGQLWSVNATTAARVPGLFARNERLVCHCDAEWGSFAVVLVGALNVGSISTAWAGEVLPRSGGPLTDWRYDAADTATCLSRGATLGQFNMGSTVIVLLPPATITWNQGLAAGCPVRTGAGLGRFVRESGRA